MGIYAKDPTLPEEEEIYDVGKTTIPSAADIAITTIAWTAAPSIPIYSILWYLNVALGSPFTFPISTKWLKQRAGRGSPFHSPISTILIMAKCHSRHPLFFPHSTHFICGLRQPLSLFISIKLMSQRRFKAAPSIPPFQLFYYSKR